MNRAGRRGAIKPRLNVNGRLDQLEDRLSGTQEAGGSNPPASTTLEESTTPDVIVDSVANLF